MLARIRAVFAEAQIEGWMSSMTRLMRRVILHPILIFKPLRPRDGVRWT